MTDTPASGDDLRALFGESFDDHQDEARERWGDTDAWQQSAARTGRYSRAEWEQVKAEADEVNTAFLAAYRAGEPADGPTATAAAEAHRQHIDRRFYDCGPDMHRRLAELYVSDPRFTAYYDASLDAPGLAQFAHDAINANADRAS